MLLPLFPAHIIVTDAMDAQGLLQFMKQQGYTDPANAAKIHPIVALLALFAGTELLGMGLLGGFIAIPLAGIIQSSIVALGIRKGDRVAIALPNIPQYPIAFYGTLKAGAVVVPTNPLYTEKELLHQLSDSGASVIVMLDSFYPSVRSILRQTPLEHVIVTSPADFLPLIPHMLYPLQQAHDGQVHNSVTRRDFQADQKMHRMRTLLQFDEVQPYLPVTLESGDLAALQYTGGTTGLSKGAMLTHRALLANTLQVRAWFAKIREGEESVLCAAPFFHAYGMTEDFRSIKYCISGAAPLPEKVQLDFEALTHGKLVEGYGLSEASPVTHCNPLTDECRKGSIGLPLPEVDAAIMEVQTGETVPVGEVGELVVRGPNVMQGYWRREEETKSVFQDGWMRTGDLAKMDEDGFPNHGFRCSISDLHLVGP